MPIEEKIPQIVTSEELSAAEKLDRLHALIPPDVFKIDSLSTVTPEQVRQLRDGLALPKRCKRSGGPGCELMIFRKLATATHSTL
jgi:hypothetical protein